MLLGAGMVILGVTFVTDFRNLKWSTKIGCGRDELAVDADTGRRELDVALMGVELRLDARRHHGHIGELLEKIEMPEGAAELAVGCDLEADILLHLDRLADRLVLDLTELLGGNLVALFLLARIEQRLGPQQTADMIGAEGRGRA